MLFARSYSRRRFSSYVKKEPPALPFVCTFRVRLRTCVRGVMMSKEVASMKLPSKSEAARWTLRMAGTQKPPEPLLRAWKTWGRETPKEWQ